MMRILWVWCANKINGIYAAASAMYVCTCNNENCLWLDSIPWERSVKVLDISIHGNVTLPRNCQVANWLIYNSDKSYQDSLLAVSLWGKVNVIHFTLPFLALYVFLLLLKPIFCVVTRSCESWSPESESFSKVCIFVGIKSRIYDQIFSMRLFCDIP